MEILREKNYKSEERVNRKVVCQDLRLNPAPVYDINCRHYSWDDNMRGHCDAHLPMCNCGIDCILSTSSHFIHIPTTKERI